MSMTELQIQAYKKYNTVLMGNGGEQRALKLYNVKILLDKQSLTEDDILVLKHFLMSDKQTIEKTTYVANTAIYPSSWGHTTTVLRKKT